MTLPLMPKATAVWLVENTALTFEQIAEFCGLHPLEVQGIADEDVAIGIHGLDPIARSQLTREEIEAREADPKSRLKLAEPRVPVPRSRPSGPRYTPVSKRQDRPNAISWLLRYHSELTDAQISRMVGTTKPTINGIRERTHWNIQNIRPQDPVSLGLCSQQDLDEAVTKARARDRKRAETEATAKERATGARTKPAPADPPSPQSALVATLRSPERPSAPIEAPSSSMPPARGPSPTPESVFGAPAAEAPAVDGEPASETAPSPEEVFRAPTPVRAPASPTPEPTPPEPPGATAPPPPVEGAARATLGAVWPKAKPDEETETPPAGKPSD